jgi:hypothetical protein
MRRVVPGFVAVLLVSPACRNPAAQKSGGDAGPSRCNELVVLADGPTMLQAHVGDTVGLSAIVAGTGSGPVAGTALAWSAKKPGTSSPPAPFVSTTDSSGIARASIAITASSDLQVTAAANGSASASWTIHVVPEPPSLQVVACPGGSLTGDTSFAFVQATAGAPSDLCVQITTSSPTGPVGVPEQLVTFSAPGVVFSVTNGTVTTDASGTATISATVSEAPFGATVHAVWGGQTVSFLVSAPGSGANISEQCGDVTPGCPAGYMCSEPGSCVPLASLTCGNCTTGFVCDGAMAGCTAEVPVCTVDGDCAGESCKGGLCYPTASPVSDVSGHWFTEHELDLSAALPTWTGIGTASLQQLGAAIAAGFALPASDEEVIAGAVSGFLPDWLPRLIQILSHLDTTFSTLHVLGEMSVTEIDDPHLVTATEIWTDLVFYDLSRCGAPTPPVGGHPACARVDLPIDELTAANLAVDIHEFTGTVSASSSGVLLSTDPRLATVPWNGILILVLNHLVADATGVSPTMTSAFTAALSDTCDCTDLSSFVASLTCGPAPAACQDAVVNAAMPWTDALSSPRIVNEGLVFSGHASVQTDPSSNQAIALGSPDFASNSPADGLWNGQISGGAFTGRWHASRTPIDAQ